MARHLMSQGAGNKVDEEKDPREKMPHYVFIGISISLFVLGIIFLFKGGLFKSQKGNLVDVTGEVDGLGIESEKIWPGFVEMQLELSDLQKVAQQNRKAAQDIKGRIEEDKAKFRL